MSFDNIKLEKGLYKTGKSFTQALESIDPSENYKGTPLEGLDAYERQLKRFNIKVSGPNCDTVSKFFATTDSAALFPEYLARAVKTGIETDDKVDRIVATTTYIDSMDYRSIATDYTDEELKLSEVAEGDTIPEITVKASDTLTKLKKRGSMLSASYEAIKFQKLDLFTITLKKIGAQIANDEFLDAISACTDFVQVTPTGGEPVFEDICNMYTKLFPYKLTTLISSASLFNGFIKLSEFRDANAGLDMHATGTPITPFGAEYICIADGKLDNLVIGLDKNYAIEKVQAGDIITEYDKLIDRQLERVTISTITGFNQIYGQAMGCMTFE